MTSYARLRAEIDIRETGAPDGNIVERFPSHSLVEILEDQGNWLHIKPLELSKTVTGFVPRLALLFPPNGGQAPLFPMLVLDGGARRIPSVPPELLLPSFRSWLGGTARLPWIAQGDWEQIGPAAAANTVAGIRAATIDNQPAWNDWLNQVNQNQRSEQALMDEWIVVASGAREVFTSRGNKIYQQADQGGSHLGWAAEGHVLRWTGQVRESSGDSLYEVDFYRMSKAMHGWYRGDILTEYVFPTPKNDPKIANNKEHVFDLSTPILRYPKDPEFVTAKATGRGVAQYLDIKSVVDRNLVHWNLCGEICSAALVGSDVIPLLTQWFNSGYPRAREILNDRNRGTAIIDLEWILGMYNRTWEVYNSIPVSAQFIKSRLMRGEFPISGCVINRNGKVTADAKTRHWVIVTDVLPVGVGGWLRIYNPFPNQEEVYEYNMFMSSSETGGGLWVRPGGNGNP